MESQLEVTETHTVAHSFKRLRIPTLRLTELNAGVNQLVAVFRKSGGRGSCQRCEGDGGDAASIGRDGDVEAVADDQATGWSGNGQCLAQHLQNCKGKYVRL